MMRLCGNVENGLGGKRPDATAGEFRKRLHQSGEDRRMVGFHAAGSKSSIGLRGVVTKSSAEGTHQMLFNLDGQWAVAPGGELGVKGRNQGVPSDAHGRRRGVEQSVIAGMRCVGLKLTQTLDKKI